MTNKTHCDLLAARFERKAATGLKDVKFFLMPHQATADEICGEVERLYEAVDANKPKPLNFGDLRWNEDAGK